MDPQMHILLSERSQSSKTAYCMTANYMIFWSRQNYGDSRKMSGAGDGRMNGQRTDNFGGSKSPLHGTVIITCHRLVQTHRMCNTKSEP